MLKRVGSIFATSIVALGSVCALGSGMRVLANSSSSRGVGATTRWMTGRLVSSVTLTGVRFSSASVSRRPPSPWAAALSASTKMRWRSFSRYCGVLSFPFRIAATVTRSVSRLSAMACLLEVALPVGSNSGGSLKLKLCFPAGKRFH